MSPSKAADRAARALGWLILLGAGMVVFRDGTPARRRLTEWTGARAASETVRREWSALAGGPLRLGAPSDAHLLVEFLDYRCSHCRAFHDTVALFLARHSEVALVVRLAPRPGDVVARFGALAAACASLQGEFARMHEYLLAADNWMSNRSWRAVREGARLTDAARFEECQNSDAARRLLVVDSQWSARLRVRGTPTFATRAHGVTLGVLTTDTLAALLRVGGRAARSAPDTDNR